MRFSAAAMKESIVRFFCNALVQANHPGLVCHNSSEIIIHGKLTVQGRVNIGRRTRVIIESGCHLILEGENDILDDVLIGPGSQMVIGRGASIQEHCTLLGQVAIGAYSLLAPRVFASSGQHAFKGQGNLPAWSMIRLQDHLQPCYGGPIKVGRDCWIGINTVILPGCKLAQGSIVGAASVLMGSYYCTKYSVIAGAPAAYVGRRWTDPSLQLSQDELHD
ncbi:MAG: hypothetical protein WCK64_03250 [Synechococcaceae cyanobacterium ELA445]